jgi:hypothetical protein
MRNNLTDAATLSERLTVTNNELARLRTEHQRAARAAPGATSGAWTAATRNLPPDDRARIVDAINCARNVFRWARRRRRLENTRWHHGHPNAELARLARLARHTREQTRHRRIGTRHHA